MDPVLLEGPGSFYDHDLIVKMMEDIVEAEVDDTHLTRNFSGDLVLDIRMRFVGGELKTTDHSLQVRRRRLYGRDS